MNSSYGYSASQMANPYNDRPAGVASQPRPQVQPTVQRFTPQQTAIRNIAAPTFRAPSTGPIILTGPDGRRHTVGSGGGERPEKNPGHADRRAGQWAAPDPFKLRGNIRYFGAGPNPAAPALAHANPNARFQQGAQGGQLQVPGGDYQGFFNQMFPGASLSPAELAAKEQELAKYGIRVMRNASGIAGKIRLPTGQSFDVIGGAARGLNRKQWLAGPVPGSPEWYAVKAGLNRPTGAFGGAAGGMNPIAQLMMNSGAAGGGGWQSIMQQLAQMLALRNTMQPGQSRMY